MLGIVLQVAIAWAYSHVLEYSLHRWLLHNRKRKQWFRNHFGDHHRIARRNMMLDSKAHDSIQIKGDPEIKGLLVLALLHAPIAIVWPFAYATLVYSSVSYFFIHRRAHQDFRWARNNLPWHYDHHMGKNQNVNWGVRLPWVDWIMGTRVPWKGEQQEEREYNNFFRTLKRVYAVRSHRDKRRKHREGIRVVSEESGREDTL